jgi:hypothetical protein
MMSYPSEKLKGRYISWFWIIFNMGAVIGSLIQLALNFDARDTTKPAAITDGTYIGFIILTFLGACLSWTLLDAKHVIRRDGTRIIMMKHPTWQSEILGLWETLRTDPYIVLLFPMFFASNWFYTYQFNDVDYARFNVRTRALNNALYWLAQILGAGLFGFALDFPNVRRTTRVKIAWAVMLVLTFAVWGGGYAFQRQYHRDDDSLHFDWTGSGDYIGPMVLYMSYGFYDAAWQTCVYWYVYPRTNMLSANSVQVHGRHLEQQSKARQLRRLLQGHSISWSSDRFSLRRLQEALHGHLPVHLGFVSWELGRCAASDAAED